MNKPLVIVESPAKIKTLKKFLGNKYAFESSVGHIRDLPQKEFGIDTEHNFEPKYETLADKKEVVKKLREAAKKAKIVYLAPDPDREGEAIAWHIAEILPKNIPAKRTAFQSITKEAVERSLANPREIDMDLVNAQQARRLLDRMVGYKISPILTRKIKRGRNGSSAGRVQSVALKLVVEREKEIQAFTPVEYWNLSADLFTARHKDSPFTATLHSVGGLKVERQASEQKPCFLIANETTAEEIASRLKKASYWVENIEKREKRRNPLPPFITSTLQQEASRHYGFSVAKTMNVAQGLYEGVDMGPEGTEGLITYMRTDSVNIAPEAISAARQYIQSQFGAPYLPSQPRVYASRKTAQEAHEGIRPTNIHRHPEHIQKYLSPDAYKLYLLIWRRFIASQMNPAIYDTVSADIATDQEMTLRATGSVIQFPGYLAVYEEKRDRGKSEEEEKQMKILPPLETNTPLSLLEVHSSQSFTKPPPRFTEASLVKELEKLGIGRPSTYAAIMNKIQSRDYTVKEHQALKPTELGQITCALLEDNFTSIMDVNFTAQLEDQLELIAEHRKDWKELLQEFWKDFIPLVEKAEKEAIVPKILTDLSCPLCSKPLQKIWSRNKYFYGCSNYPDCEFTSPIEALTFNKADYAEDFDWEQSCSLCQSPMTLRHGRFGAFLGCSKYPDCKGIVNIPKKGEKVYSDRELPPCPAIGCDGTLKPRKSRFGKLFFSCSNYPDCDVIVNELDQVSSKYPHHPKTPYTPKYPKGKGKKATGKKTSSKKKTSSPRQQKTYTLSPSLSALLGETQLTRPEATKKLWVYIKKHKLQNPSNKRIIQPDTALAQVIGKKPVDMMQLASLLSPHLS